MRPARSCTAILEAPESAHTSISIGYIAVWTYVVCFSFNMIAVLILTIQSSRAVLWSRVTTVRLLDSCQPTILPRLPYFPCGSMDFPGLRGRASASGSRYYQAYRLMTAGPTGFETCKESPRGERARAGTRDSFPSRVLCVSRQGRGASWNLVKNIQLS